MVQSYVCDEAFEHMKQSLERGDVEKFDEKWSKMLGIRQGYWKHPRGLKFARRYGFPKEGYKAVVKKRFRKKPMYIQDNMDLQLLAPFDDGTIVEGAGVEELILVNFITGPELGIQMPSLTYLHDNGSNICRREQGYEVPHELGPSFDTMAKSFVAMESHRRTPEMYFRTLQYVYTVPPRVLNTKRKYG
jgi:hypothetical protein